MTFAHRWHWFNGTGGHSVELLPGHGYLVAGETQLDSIHNGVVVFRADSLGDTTSVRQFSGYDPGSGMLCRVADSGYVVVGTRNSYHILVTKYTANGDSTWAWLSAYAGEVSTVIPTFDGGCLVAGRLPDTGVSFGMVKLAANGQESWVHSYPDPRVHGSFARGVAQTRDSGFIMCGDCYDYEGPYLRLVRTNPNGDTLWTRIYTQPSGPYVPAVCEAPDSGFLVAGSELDTFTGANALYLLRTGPAGDIVWSRRLARPGTATSAAAMAKTWDGGYVLAGQIDWFDTARVWLVKLDASGDTQWTSILPGVLREAAASVRQTDDLGCVVVGTSEADGRSLLLCKTDSLGRIFSGMSERPAAPSRLQASTVGLKVCPNPAAIRSPQYAIRIAFSLPVACCIGLKLYDATGRLLATLATGYHAAGNYAVPVSHSDGDIGHSRPARGVYFLKLDAGPDHITRQLILE